MKKLIDKIIALPVFEDVSFYTIHLPKPIWHIFNYSIRISKRIPVYLQELCIMVSPIIKSSGLTQQEMLLFLANSEVDTSYLFVSDLILRKCTNIELDDKQIDNILFNSYKFPDGLIIDHDYLCFAIVACALDTNRYRLDIKRIVLREQFLYSVTDYKLTAVKDIFFHQFGFVYCGKYYLYNRFIDRRQIASNSDIPAIFRILIDNIDLSNSSFYLRLDERLAIPTSEADMVQLEIAEYYRGIAFNYSQTRLNGPNNILMRLDPVTLNKLLMVIKTDTDDEDFWHIEIEELPYYDKTITRQYVQTVFLHGKYYPRHGMFRHVDFAINQYEFSEYCDKQDKHIDHHTTKVCHYKLWCIENTDIPEEVWCKLVKVSLHDEYASLFDEILLSPD